MIIDPTGMTPVERYHFMISAIVPRPIAWVTTVSEAGVVNAAPFSFFSGISSSPPLVGVCVGKKRDKSPKDTLANAEATREMVVNIVPWDLREEMVATAAALDHDVSEVEAAGLRTEPSESVKPPRLADSPVQLECRVDRIIDFGGTSMIVGEVLRFVAEDSVLQDGRVVFDRVRPIGRLGGDDYLDHEAGIFQVQ